ncbi:MAG: hypothetical protein ACI9OJ_003427, partial [Myxococcota bacterium]
TASGSVWLSDDAASGLEHPNIASPRMGTIRDEHNRLACMEYPG